MFNKYFFIHNDGVRSNLYEAQEFFVCRKEGTLFWHLENRRHQPKNN